MQIGPQGCIPFDPDSSVIQEVSKIQLAREVVRVHSPPFWTLSSSKGVYQVAKANISHSQGERNPPDCISGRFSHRREEQEGDRTGVSGNKGPDGESWICDKRGEITEQSFSSD